MPRTLVLHIGTPKAGSTTIQKTLFKYRNELASSGILIPTNNGASMSWADAVHYFKDFGEGGEKFSATKSIERQIKEFEGEAIIFSSETFFHMPQMKRQIEKFLKYFADRVRICVYVRDPASYYLSLQQQRIKAHHSIHTPQEWQANYQKNILGWGELNAEQFEIVPFDRSEIKGDLTVDLLSRMLPEYSIPNKIRSKNQNTSDCAEVSSILQEYHRQCYSGTERKLREDSAKLRHTLAEVSKEHNLGQRAKLRPEIRDYILDKCLLDIEFMKQRSVTWKNCEVKSGPINLDSKTLETTLFDDIVEIDYDERREILYRGLSRLCGKV